MQNRVYTGIGSRETPENVLRIFRGIGADLAKKGFTLRSGGAEGADSSFEEGCDSVNGKKEIYLPWRGFNKRTYFIEIDKAYEEKAREIASQFHPAWNRCSQGAKSLHARNTHQILGKDCETLTDFVICWTPKTGGTNQALRIAKHYNVQIFNIFNKKDIDNFLNFFHKL